MRSRMTSAVGSMVITTPAPWTTLRGLGRSQPQGFKVTNMLSAAVTCDDRDASFERSMRRRGPIGRGGVRRECAF